MSFTPGEWTFDEVNGEILSDIDPDGFLVATVESNDADGPLLAQSKALLEVAQMIVEHAEFGMPEGILRAATIAVSRAKGTLR